MSRHSTGWYGRKAEAGPPERSHGSPSDALGRAANRPGPFARLGVMDRAFETAFATPVAFLVTTGISAVLIGIFLRAALVPQSRSSGWTRPITGRNGRYFFGLLLVAWMAGMGVLASLGLNANEIGGPAFIGLLAGFFLFMGFIWSVIGE